MLLSTHVLRWCLSCWAQAVLSVWSFWQWTALVCWLVAAWWWAGACSGFGCWRTSPGRLWSCLRRTRCKSLLCRGRRWWSRRRARRSWDCTLAGPPLGRWCYPTGCRWKSTRGSLREAGRGTCEEKRKTWWIKTNRTKCLHCTTDYIFHI